MPAVLCSRKGDQTKKHGVDTFLAGILCMGRARLYFPDAADRCCQLYSRSHYRKISGQGGRYCCDCCGFIAENINALFSCSIPVPDIRLPIGISFYTFQTISYIIDCHWEKVKPQKSFKNFLLFLTLFPQLVAGPIVRYSTIEKEIENPLAEKIIDSYKEPLRIIALSADENGIVLEAR